MDVGKALSEARLRAGRSREEIAQHTKIPLASIRALEENAFERLPKGIYLYGFIRAYAAEVAADPAPLLAQVRQEVAPRIEPEELSFAPDDRAPTRFGELVMPMLLVAASVGALALGAYWFEIRSTPVAPTEARKTQAPRSVGTAGSSADMRSPSSPSEPPAAAPVTSAVAGARAIDSSPDLSGEWTVTTRIDSSSVPAFEGLRLGYRVDLQHSGNRLSGSGRKVSEGGTAIGEAGQTTISVEGKTDGERVTLTFVEKGARRPSSGTFVMTRESDDLLRGRFSSEAAQSAGAVEARRR